MNRKLQSTVLSGVLAVLGTTMSACDPQSSQVGAEFSGLESSSIQQQAEDIILSGGVVLSLLESDIVLNADRLRVRQGEPWEAFDFVLTAASSTIQADHGYFDPIQQTFSAEGGVRLSVEPDIN